MKKFYLLFFILVICTSCAVYPEDIKKAEELCKNNGGIEYIVVSDKKIKCQNGAFFNL